MSLQTNRISAEKDCDLLVIGGGGAGMVAAARAACQSHRKIIVLEKTKLTGGAALFASTLRTFRSHWQEKRGIPDQMDDFIRKGMDATGWQLDPRLVNNCCLATGRFFDWFCQVGGAGTEEKFKPAPYVFDGPDGQLGPELIGGYCHHGTGYLVMQILLDFCCKNGVEILTLHRAVDVEISHGKITAVLAEGPAGTVRICCRACIMASGSWVRNETLMRRLEPRFLNVLNELDSSCRPHVRDIYTGDAIALAEKAGAAVDYDNMCLRMMGPCVRSSSQVLNSMGTSPYGISVNLHGARWSCEPIQWRMGLFRAGHVLFRQPKGLTYFIF